MVRSTLAAATFGLAAAQVPLIIDTDMGFDVDDVGAVCAAHALETLGEAKILAIMHDTGYSQGIGAVSAINHYYGRDDIELGAWRGEFGRDGSTQDQYVPDLVDNFDPPVTDYFDVDDPVTVYRRVLSQQPDASVTIASVGMTTALADLMRSGGDQYSDLDGPALVGKKVKEIVWMDGMYNFGCAEAQNQAWLGDDADCFGSARQAVMNVPANVKQRFSLVGEDVISGGRLSECADDDNPCRQAYIDWCGYGNGRSSWDPLATVLAVRGEAGSKLRLEDCGGTMSVDDWGNEDWSDGTGSNQCRVEKDASDDDLVEMLEDLYCLPPGKPSPKPTPTPTPMPTPTPSPSNYYPDVKGMCALDTTAESGAGPAMDDYGGGDFSMAWDGDVDTFYDYSDNDGGWTQAKLASASAVGHIEFYPRDGFEDRNVGGRFLGIRADGSAVQLATVSWSPRTDWNGLGVSAGDVVVSVRYEAPDDGYGNIAEIKVYSTCTMLV